MEEKLLEKEEQKEGQTEEKVLPKRLFGKGVYGKGDVPIKILDAMIVFFAVSIITLVVVFAINGGYYVSFDTDGGSVIEKQKLSYGDFVELPEEPVKPGYEFVNWVTSQDEYLAEIWNFEENKIETDLTLYAVWTPAEFVVKFDVDGGSFPEGTAYEKQVVYGEAYGDLPTPEKEGFLFDGWVYSGQMIDETTTVQMTGEHLLTARWIPE